MKKNNKWIAPISAILAVALIVGLGGFFTVKAWSGQKAHVVVEGNATINIPPENQSEENIGGSPGLDHLAPERFWQGFNSGILSTSTTESLITLTEDTLYKFHIIEMFPYAANLTITLPATSTLSSILPNDGDWDRWVFRNMSSSTDVGHGKPTITIAKGIGWELMGTNIDVDVINASSTLMMDCFRSSTTSTWYQSRDIVCDMRELVNVD